MKKIKNLKEAFAKDGLDPEKIEIIGVPERHIEAVKSFAKLCVVHDAVNPNFNPDWENSRQYKYQNWFAVGSPSGVGFSYGVYGDWTTSSVVGSRLVSESLEAAEYIAEHEEFGQLYKTMMVYERKTEE